MYKNKERDIIIHLKQQDDDTVPKRVFMFLLASGLTASEGLLIDTSCVNVCIAVLTTSRTTYIQRVTVLPTIYQLAKVFNLHFDWLHIFVKLTYQNHE